MRYVVVCVLFGLAMANPEVEELRAQIRALSAQNAAQAKSHEMQLAANEAQIKAKDAQIEKLRAAAPAEVPEPQASQKSQGSCEAVTTRAAGASLPWQACPVGLLREQLVSALGEGGYGYGGYGSTTTKKRGFDWSQCKSEVCAPHASLLPAQALL